MTYAPPTMTFPREEASNARSSSGASGPETLTRSSPHVSPPTPKIPWMKAPRVSTVTPERGWTSTIVPST